MLNVILYIAVVMLTVSSVASFLTGAPITGAFTALQAVSIWYLSRD
jgi:hypothetical protein